MQAHAAHASAHVAHAFQVCAACAYLPQHMCICMRACACACNPQVQRRRLDLRILVASAMLQAEELHAFLLSPSACACEPQVQRRRPDLRILVASATLQAEELRAFFDPGRDASMVKAAARAGVGAPAQRTPAIISIEGRTHPVEVGQARPGAGAVRGSFSS